MSRDYAKEMYADPRPKENQEGRIPPQAVEVEENVLGGTMLEEEAALTAFEMLNPDDFYKPAHGHIFESMLELFLDDKSIDLLAIENDLRDKGLLDTCGGAGYLSELTRSVSSAANIEYHAQILAEKSKKRKLIKTCTNIIKEAYQPEVDVYEVLDEAENSIFELAQEKNTEEAKHIREHLQTVLERYEKVMENPDEMEGVSCGLDIDEILTNFKDTLLYILAARPSMGKTALALQIARGVADGEEEERTNVGIFSLEMSADSLVDRLILGESHIDGQKARSGEIGEEEFKRMIDASSRLFDQNIYVDDTPGINLMQLRSKARHMIKKQGVGLILIDYLQLMSYSGKAGTREQEITKISQGLKGIAMEYDVPVVALSQLSRAVEMRGGDKRPQLSDLRESGSIEQDADVVMFLYRPEYYDIKTTPEGQSTEGVAEVLVKKQRNGPTGMVPLRFIEKYAKFENPSFHPIGEGGEEGAPF